MIYQKSYSSTAKFFLLLILGFVLISIVLVGISSPTISIISKSLIYFSLSCLIIAFINQGMSNVKYDLHLIALLFLILWIGIRTENLYGFGLFLQAFLLLCGAFVAKNNDFSQSFDKVMLSCGLMYILLAGYHFLFSPVFVNTNYIGACGLLFCVFYLSRSSFLSFCLSLVCFLLLVLSGTRSALLGLLVGFIAYKFLKARKSVRLIIALAIFVTIFLFFFYDWHSYILSPEFSQFVIERTGKRLESGRVEIWTTIFAHMKLTDYIIGLGGGINYQGLIGMDLSPHSGYVYLISSYGIIGLLLFILTSFLSLKKLLHKNYYYSFLLSVAFLVREFFEVTLIHNSFPLALFFWAFLSNGYLDNRRIHRFS